MKKTQILELVEEVFNEISSEEEVAKVERALLGMAPSYKTMAIAVGKVLRDEYGKHTFKDFFSILKAELEKDENQAQ